MKKTWIKLWIHCLVQSVAECDVHSLQFLSTGRVDPGVQPQFEQLTLFDRVPISYCDSDTRKEQPRPALESGPVSETCDEGYYNMVEAIFDITRLVSSSAEVVQRRRGCLLWTNGTVSSFESWAVDGEDFIQFDADSQTWTPLSSSAEKLQHQWNNKKNLNYVCSIFVRKWCPDVMSKVQLKVTQQRTELRVFGKDIGSRHRALLRCHVTSSDQSVSSLQLIGGVALWSSVSRSKPSEDGCVVLRLTAGISLSQDGYGCRVETGSGSITVLWDGKTLDGTDLRPSAFVSSPFCVVIVGFFCILMSVAASTCLFICFSKCVVRMKESGRPQRVDPVLKQQFTEMDQRGVAPDLHTSRDWYQWARRTIEEDQDFYDPEFFAADVEESVLNPADNMRIHCHIPSQEINTVALTQTTVKKPWTERDTEERHRERRRRDDEPETTETQTALVKKRKVDDARTRLST